MTYIPEYLKTYPNMHSSYPLHISLNRITDGFRAHRHDFLEFSYVIDGSGYEAINDAKHEMTVGTFTFVQPYQVHELFTAPGNTLVLYNCMFSMDLLMELRQDTSLIGLIDFNGLPPFVQLTGQDNEKMLLLIQDMYKEYKGNEPWRLMMLQVRLREILIAFDRHRRAGTIIHTATPAATIRNTSIWPIIHYIHQNYQEDLALTDLAVQFKMSASRISEVIKQTTGQTFVHFLHDLRIRHACSLLVSTEMSVSEIALEVGYGSYKTFSRVFRETKGMVPKDYRKTSTAKDR